jgi:hypothetical protein
MRHRQQQDLPPLIYYWRPAPGEELPDVDLDPQNCRILKEQFGEYFDMDNPLCTKGASNSTWGNDRGYGRCTGGAVFLLAGGAIYYRTRNQATVAQSSTKAKFGSMTLYIPSVLEELQLEQVLPTQIVVDNRTGLDNFPMPNNPPNAPA